MRDVIRHASREASPVGEPEDGFIVGSVMVKMIPSQEGTLKNLATILFGQKASWGRFRLLATPVGGGPFASEYAIEAAADEEHFFFTRLPAGGYRFYRLEIGNLYSMTNVRFRVRARETVYIGRIEVTIDENIRMGRPLLIEVRDLQPETVEALRVRHPSRMGDWRRRLAAVH